MATEPTHPVAVWHLAEMAAQQQTAFNEFFRIPALSLEIYKLPAGGVDGQKPHNEDEAYYVISGKAKIDVEGDVRAVAPGDLIFVAAKAHHKFIDIEEDLTVLVIFAPAFTGNPE
ncbi:MAG: cupin [Anaerolineaceae bacterium]|nr:cupin [Anaerolineaceae bacterium]